MKSSIALFSFVVLLFFVMTGCEREEVEELIPEEPVATEVTISIEGPDRILVDGEAMTRDELKEFLANLAEEELVYAYIHTTPGVDDAVIDEVRETIRAVEGVEVRPDIPDMEPY